MCAKLFYPILLSLTVILFGCSDVPLNDDQIRSSQDLHLDVGASQISGVSYYADPAECDYIGQGADFALILSGDFEGCLYAFVENYNCSPSGTYRESGYELFVGTYKGEQGSFMTGYRFEGKYEGCENGLPVGAEIFGRCQHPIIEDSGTGAFEGVSGRINFKDDVVKQEFPYSGHLRY